MGLDQYLTAEKRLNKRSKIDRQYINYFNTIDRPEDVEQMNSDDGLWISVYFNSKYIADHLATMPKLTGQVGNIKTVKRDGDSFIIYTEAGYWRKANQVHKWFIDNCQDGEDKCQKTMITVNDLVSLQNIINTFGRLPTEKQFRQIYWQPRNELVATAQKLLPTHSGFFFGSTKYDDLYFYNIKETKKILRSVLKQSTINTWQLSYQSSW